MKVSKVHCLFEQSGTFKNEFIKLGIPAEDYDIRNDFNQTDHLIDLFSEIRLGYDNKPSIFENIKQDELMFAFFPCIRFEDQILLLFSGTAKQMAKWDDCQKLKYDLQLQKELSEMYELVTKLAIIAKEKCLRVIIENPYSTQHYLNRYWCLKPNIIDKDRCKRGDYYKKPTQYWFINCEPEFNDCFEIVDNHEIGTIVKPPKELKQEKNNNNAVVRSMIHPDYANRFIREFILTGKPKQEQQIKLN